MGLAGRLLYSLEGCTRIRKRGAVAATREASHDRSVCAGVLLAGFGHFLYALSVSPVWMCFCLRAERSAISGAPLAYSVACA